MRPILTAFAAVLLWSTAVSAGFEISDLLFRPDFDADKELMERAQGSYQNDVYQPQGTDTSVEVQIDLCDPETFKEMFQDLTFRPEEYTRYKGLDHTALFASSVTLSDKYAVVGSNGYDVFKGIVHVYVPKTTTKWSLQALIRSPVWDNGNFGNDVSVDGERIVVAANAFAKYDGIVFVYERNLLHNCWLLTGTIYSPLASGPNRTMSQGFGYRVDMSGEFLIASTAINNAYIFREVSPGKWVLHTDLQAPARDIFFGRAVAIEDDLAVVGAYGWERNVGRVFVYRYHPETDSWDLLDQLSPLRTQSNFGYSLDIHNTSIVVGANGYYKYQYENTQQFDARLTQPAVNYGWAYVFQLAPNGSKYVMEQEIASPVGNNSYFGSGVGIYGNSIIVGADGYPCFGLTGAGFVFNKGPDGWQLNQSYPSPAGKEGHFGYAVDINANYSAIGAYGFDELRGAIYLADRRARRYVPPPIPASLPTMMPSAPSEILSGGGLDREVGKTGLTLGMLLALALGVLVVAGAAGMVIYCCCCMVPILPLLKKKKKREDEEEESPYTVHSYVGYVEEDIYLPPPPPAPVVIVEQEVAAGVEKDLKKEKSVKFMENGEMRKLFPYKVYGPRGYVEEGSEQGVPEDLLTQKKERDDEVLRAAKGAETRYEYAEYAGKGDGEVVPMKGLPPPPVQHDARPFVARRDSYGSQHSQYDDSRHMMYERRSEQRTSWVNRARQNYESSYSLGSHGTALTEEDGGTVYNSLSSMTSQSQQQPQHLHGAYTAAEQQRLQQRTASFYNYEDLHDDETVMSGATQDTAKSGGSLVGKAREHYRKILSQSQMQQQQVTTTTTTTTTTRNVVQDSDSTSGLSGSGSTGSGSSGFVAAAKEKYARLKAGGQPLVAENRSQWDSSSTGDGETRGSSLVDRLKARGAALAMSESGASSGPGTSSAASASHVAAAKAQYRTLQRQGLGIASASADADDHTGDGDATSVVTRSSALSAGSGGSIVDDIKARYAKMRADSSSAASQSQTQSQYSASTTSGQVSLVDQIKARHRASLTSEPSGGSAHDDDSTVLTQSTADSRASHVDAARAKYMKLRELRRQALGGDAASGSASVQSGESRSAEPSLVEAAKARGEALKRATDTSVATGAAVTGVESDGHSVLSQSQTAGSVSQQSYSESGDQSAYMVNAIKARYQASTRLSSAQSTSTYSANTHTEHAVTGGATQGDEVSQSPSSAPSSGNSVDSARSAAMNKFAFYKAKAEAEAAKARAVTDSASQSSVSVRLKERVGPLRREDSEWTMDDASEAVTAMSFGDERSAGAETRAESAGFNAEEVRARAMARAREKFARAKELAAQDGAATTMGADRAAEQQAGGAGRSSAVEEALRRLRESHSIPDPPSASQVPAVGSTSTVVHHNQSTSTTRTVTESAAHSRSVDATSTVTREATQGTVPRAPEEP